MIAVGRSLGGNKSGFETEGRESVGSERSKAVHAFFIGAEAVNLDHAAEQLQAERQIPLEELFELLRIYGGHEGRKIKGAEMQCKTGTGQKREGEARGTDKI